MSKSIRDWEATVARIAGNIAGPVVAKADRPLFFLEHDEERKLIAVGAVALARDIVEEVRRTGPKDADQNS